MKLEINYFVRCVSNKPDRTRICVSVFSKCHGSVLSYLPQEKPPQSLGFPTARHRLVHSNIMHLRVIDRLESIQLSSLVQGGR